MNIKKFTFILLLAILLLVPNDSFAYENGNSSVYKGLKSSTMSTEISDFEEASFLEIDSLSIVNGNKIVLKGKLDNVPLYIDGEIYLSKLKESEFIIDAKSNGLEVFLMSYISDAMNRDDFILDHEASNEILKLYFKKDNNFYVFEIEKMLDLFKDENISNLPDDLTLKEQWWIEIFNPVIENINSEVFPQPMNYNNVITNRRRYSYPQTNYEYVITILGEINTSNLVNNSTNGYVTLYIDNQQTYYKGALESNHPILGIANSTIKVNLDANNYDKFSRIEWQTNSNYPNRIFNLTLGYGIGPVNIEYNVNKNTSSGSILIPVNASRRYKLISINNKTPLKSIGDSHQVYYRILQDNYYSGRHYITANINYSLFFVNNHGIFNNDSMTLRGGYN